jgi:uncharacterized protein YlxW (UPF0749 family)
VRLPERPRGARSAALARIGRAAVARFSTRRDGVGRGWRVAGPLVFALAGLLATTSATTARGTDLRSPGGRDLADSIRSEQRRVDEQLRRVTALRADIDATTRQLGGDSAAGDATERLRHAAGFAPVTGPAITVTLDDAPRKPGTPLPEGVSPDDVIVHQQDVQAVVNALWAGGAEAMQLMDQRVISTSAVRCVGNVLILQGRQYPPPYTVTAIGPVERLREALERSSACRSTASTSTASACATTSRSAAASPCRPTPVPPSSSTRAPTPTRQR